MFSASSRTEDSRCPEVEGFTYDGWCARVTLRFDDQREPTYIEFDHVVGIRILDEGQLSDYWEQESRPSGWLWQLHGGGWFDLESNRDGFIMGAIAADGRPDEYLIVGANDCVTVLSWGKPAIRTAILGRQP